MVKIELISKWLCDYTYREPGVAVLANTDARTADLYLEGVRYDSVLKELPNGEVVLLRRRIPLHYTSFDLLGPITPQLLLELGENYHRLLQARLTPSEMSLVLGADLE